MTIPSLSFSPHAQSPKHLSRHLDSAASSFSCASASWNPMPRTHEPNTLRGRTSRHVAAGIQCHVLTRSSLSVVGPAETPVGTCRSDFPRSATDEHKRRPAHTVHTGHTRQTAHTRTRSSLFVVGPAETPAHRGLPVLAAFAAKLSSRTRSPKMNSFSVGHWCASHSHLPML